MTGFPIPKALADSVARHGPDARRAWMDRLPETVGLVTDRWGLTVGAPYQPGGMVSWVAPARTPAGDDVVLKVGWGHPDARYEAEGLRRWGGNGAVLLHEAWAFADTCALLLEQCDPGALLKSRPEAEQDVVVAELLLRLWEAPTDGPFRSLDAMCQEWADEHEADVAAGGIPGGAGDPLDPGIVREGLALYRALPLTATRSVLLCTDLHAENILSAQREPWLVIDPKPHVGDPTYDTVQHLLNCPERLRADPVGIAHRMADLTGLDRERQVQWLFARCVQESVGWPELAPVARALASR